MKTLGNLFVPNVIVCRFILVSWDLRFPFYSSFSAIFLVRRPLSEFYNSASQKKIISFWKLSARAFFPFSIISFMLFQDFAFQKY